MNRKQIAARLLGAVRGLKAAGSKLYSVLNGEWLAKLRLKDHYEEKRSSS